jgi:hypothetical protein
MRYLVIRSGYVIQAIEWDGVTPYTYPHPHDKVLPDSTDGWAGIGDWYEEAEGRFLRYVDHKTQGLPEDAPEELQKKDLPINE